MGLHDQIQGAIKLIKEASGFDFNRRQPFLFFQVAFLHSRLGPFHVAKRLLNSYKIGNNFFEYRSDPQVAFLHTHPGLWLPMLVAKTVVLEHQALLVRLPLSPGKGISPVTNTSA